MDEPCSALDPISTAKVEELIEELAADYTIVIVTHNMQQASRASDYTDFMFLGEVGEYGATEKIFTAPDNKRTEQYITGRFGWGRGVWVGGLSGWRLGGVWLECA